MVSLLTISKKPFKLRIYHEQISELEASRFFIRNVASEYEFPSGRDP
jgi:hypothetical protein